MPNIKTLNLPVSEMKNFEVGLLWSYLPICDPGGRASFDPMGIIWTNLVEVNKQMLYTKYESFKPSRLREEEFWILPSLFLYSKIDPRGRGQSWPEEHNINKLGRGPQGDAAYQISKLYALRVSKKKNFEIFFLCSYVPTYLYVKSETLQHRTYLHSRAIIWWFFC